MILITGLLVSRLQRIPYPSAATLSDLKKMAVFFKNMAIFFKNITVFSEKMAVFFSTRISSVDSLKKEEHSSFRHSTDFRSTMKIPVNL